MEDLKSISGMLDAILGKTNLSKVTKDGAGFEELPDGYYLCEVEKGELTASKSSGKPMVKFTFKAVDDGWTLIVDEASGDATFVQNVKAKGRKLFKNYVLDNEGSVKRYVSDMLKFEDPEQPGVSILSSEYFLATETLLDALDILSSGLRIYIYISSKENKDTHERENIWYNLVKWQAIEALQEEYNVNLI